MYNTILSSDIHKLRKKISSLNNENSILKFKFLIRHKQNANKYVNPSIVLFYFELFSKTK
jgi:hypothetical protein